MVEIGEILQQEDLSQETKKCNKFYVFICKGRRKFVMKEQILEVMRILNKWGNTSERVLANGTKQICHVPYVAPEAWLHEIYAGISEEDINGLEAKLQIQLPTEYREFLGNSNGINIFSDNLSICGVRKSYSRIGDEAVQPYSIVDLNTERPKGCPNTWLFFGSYSWDGSTMIFDLKDGKYSNKVYRCERWSTKIIQEWSNFDTWLLSETKRLSVFFNESGIEYDESVPTVPSV